MNKIILLDSNSLIHRAYHALPFLSNSKGQPTGAIYGFLNILLSIIKKENPTHIVAAFDLKAPTFRHKLFEEYKGTRKPMDDALKLQFEPLKELLVLMGIKVVSMEGFEADDILGTLSKKFEDPTIIVTGDKDSFQLVGENSKIFWTKKGVSELEEITLEKLQELGFESTKQFIDFKALRGDTSDNIPGIKGVGEKTAMNLLAKYHSLDGVFEHADEISGKIGETIRNSKEIAYLSKELSIINRDVPIECKLDDCVFEQEFDFAVKQKLIEFEMPSLISRMSFRGEEANANFQEDKIEFESIAIKNKEDFAKIFDGKDEFALLLGENVSVATDLHKEYIVEYVEDLFSDGISFEDTMQILRKKVIEKKLVAFDIKKMARENDFELKDYFDVKIAGHLAKGSVNIKSYDALFESEMMPQSAVSLLIAKNRFEKSLKEQNMMELFSNIELPLVKVLLNMELRGFSVEKEKLFELKKEFSLKIEELTKEIHQLAGQEFNIGSPKQMAEVLFVELGLKTGKKNKTGFSVNEDTLEKLKFEHPIIPLILEWRHMSKLNSTYVVGLSDLIEHGKIHTEFNQALTATGRLSSTNPNLQNIPQRAVESKQIKEAFVGTGDNLLISADYSQIELRLLAHFSEDEGLIEQYKMADDIHSATASQIFGVPVESVTPNMRRDAKAVNFGIVYGISDFGLATNLSIPVYKAKEFIEKYFETYPSVKKFLDGTIQFAKDNGYAITLKNRRRRLDEIHASNYIIRSSAERMAMNTPLQGSAADVVKIAMLKVEKRLVNMKSKMILQVHDELIVDASKDEVEEVAKILKEEMENAVELRVPLIANVEIGKNWGSMEKNS